MKKMIRIIIAMAVVLATAASLLSACVPEGDRYKKENLVKTEIYGDGYNNNMIVGFDNFGRTVPSASGVRDSRQVGIFYFVWLGAPSSPEIYDVSKILEEYGKEGEETDGHQISRSFCFFCFQCWHSSVTAMPRTKASSAMST